MSNLLYRHTAQIWSACTMNVAVMPDIYGK